MKKLSAILFVLCAFLLISSSDANAGGYYSGYRCSPSFGFGFYGGFYPPVPSYGYYPYYGYYSPYYGNPYYYGGFGYYNRPYYGGYRYYGRYYRPYSHRSFKRLPRIQKPYYGSRSVRRY